MRTASIVAAALPIVVSLAASGCAESAAETPPPQVATPQAAQPPQPGGYGQAAPPAFPAQPGYQQPPPGYVQAPSGYVQPPPSPGYAPPPGYQVPPPSYGYAPPPGYQQPPPGYQQPPPGYPPAPGTTTTTAAAFGRRAAIMLVGHEANPGKQERCNRVITEMGWMLDPNAPLRAELTLDEERNRLRVFAMGRQLEDLPREGWGMEQLCRDALQHLERAMTTPVAVAQPPGAPGPGPQMSAPPSGTPPRRTSITMVGSAANPDKQARCDQVIVQQGYTVDPSAPLRAELILDEHGNRLRMISAVRGVLFEQPRGGWPVEALCADALAQIGMNTP